MSASRWRGWRSALWSALSRGEAAVVAEFLHGWGPFLLTFSGALLVLLVALLVLRLRRRGDR